jgi:hypothetical protein
MERNADVGTEDGPLVDDHPHVPHSRGMVLLVVLTMNAGPADGATSGVKPGTQHIAAPVHLSHNRSELRKKHLTWTNLFVARVDGNLLVPDA